MLLAQSTYVVVFLMMPGLLEKQRTTWASTERGQKGVFNLEFS